MQKLTTKIFIDGGEVAETIRANEFFLAHFGYPLDGQTTNPSLIAKNLQAKMEQEGNAGKLTPELAIEEYKKIVRAISSLLPHGSVSIQVFANKETPADEMLTQARERITWIQNASIKIPCTLEGLKAAVIVCKEMPINITLVFSLSQGLMMSKLGVYYISPFIGRLDDVGEDGLELIMQLRHMLDQYQFPTKLLTASIRDVERFEGSIMAGADVATVPVAVLEQAVVHPLTDKGMAQFLKDWQSLHIERFP